MTETANAWNESRNERVQPMSSYRQLLRLLANQAVLRSDKASSQVRLSYGLFIINCYSF
jgi:hypothetical protein